MDLKFRPLRKDEIECRVQQVTDKGAVILLYKDARCDMRLLDETVGAMNWQRSHDVVNGHLFCTVSIWDEDKKQWISKQDVGTESNTEKEKGESSDSFKRACFCFGIGRELYTAPFIFVKKELFKTYINKQGKEATSDRFKVSAINVEDGVIKLLEITNTGQYGNDNNVVFRYPAFSTETNKGINNEPKREEPPTAPKQEEQKREGQNTKPSGAKLASDKQKTTIYHTAKRKNIDLLEFCGKDVEQLTIAEASDVISRLFNEEIKA